MMYAGDEFNSDEITSGQVVDVMVDEGEEEEICENTERPYATCPCSDCEESRFYNSNYW